MDLLMLGLGLLFFGLGFKLLLGYKKRELLGIPAAAKEDCRKGHTWRSFPAEHDSELEYLKCICCNRTLSQIMEG